ncbi:hypothetical protein Taro_001165 [Colocasia esculenta]|uniref:CCHC-type domain-containing protein n=1 Tax=Colocasia esculenta TaxID=4460 RepID=A0A843TJW4_COLES|nr:hypothetical protein [Colocasia esculenta]
MNPPRFGGSTEPDEAEHWLKEIERVFRMMGCTDGNKFKEYFNNKYFSDRVQERKAAEFTNLKQRSLSIAEYEAQFSKLARYAPHLVQTERLKAKRFMSTLRPQYITQLGPMDLQTYPEMVRKALLLKDSLAIVETIRSSVVSKEASDTIRTPHSNHHENKRSNGEYSVGKDKKIKLEEEPIGENCKFCDKPGHRVDACWKKVGACLRCGSHDHRIPNCPKLKDQTRGNQRVPKRQGTLNIVIQVGFPTEGGDEYEELENDGTRDE